MDASDLQQFTKEKVPTEKSFGLTVGTILLVCSGFFLSRSNYLVPAIGIFLILTACLWPSVLRVPNKYWMKLGLLMGRIASPLVMAVIFFLFITPFGIFLRRLNKLQFRHKFDRSNSADSFWIERSAETIDAEKLQRQF